MKRPQRILASFMVAAMLPGLLLPGGVALSFCLHSGILHLAGEGIDGACCPVAARSETPETPSCCCSESSDERPALHQDRADDGVSCCVALLQGRDSADDPAETVRFESVDLAPPPAAAPGFALAPQNARALSPRVVAHAPTGPPGLCPLLL